MEKRILIGILLVSFVFLFSASLVSSSWFDDLFGKFTGKVVVNGMECNIDDECVSGYCNPDTGAGIGICGARVLKELGDGCGFDSDCKSNSCDDALCIPSEENTIEEPLNLKRDNNTNISIIGEYTTFNEFPEKFFDESNISKEQVVKVIDAQYLALMNLHGGISPYDYSIIEYRPEVYGSTLPYGMSLGDSAFPSLNLGNHRWEVMAHEQGHNFFGGTSTFYINLATPYPFLQESLAVLSAFYTYHYILDNSGGLEQNTINSLNFDFENGRNYQETMYNEYVSNGRNFDINDVQTSQSLDYKMIEYGETYGWENYKNLAKAFEDEISVQFNFHKDGTSDIEQSTYIIATLSASFNRNFRPEFSELNFPINQTLYSEIYPKINAYISGESEADDYSEEESTNLGNGDLESNFENRRRFWPSIKKFFKGWFE
jgi:hypothetical protein